MHPTGQPDRPATQPESQFAGQPTIVTVWCVAAPFIVPGRHGGSVFLDKLATTPVSGKLLRLLALPFKAAYVLDEQVEQAYGCRQPVQLPAQVETFRWQQQITAARDCDEMLTLEADVVILGSSAGGWQQPELACRGLAVVIIEEGQLLRSQPLHRQTHRGDPQALSQLGSNRDHRQLHHPCTGGMQCGQYHDHQFRHLHAHAAVGAAALASRDWRPSPEQAMAPWFEGVEHAGVQQAPQRPSRPHRRPYRPGAAANGLLAAPAADAQRPGL